MAKSVCINFLDPAGMTSFWALDRSYPAALSDCFAGGIALSERSFIRRPLVWALRDA